MPTLERPARPTLERPTRLTQELAAAVHPDNRGLLVTL